MITIIEKLAQLDALEQELENPEVVEMINQHIESLNHVSK